MNSTRIAWLRPDDPVDAFPPLDEALQEPDGLLAAGGDLSQQRLLYAYRHGIFPWYDTGQPILWWSPDPRCILRPHEYRVPSRLVRWLRKSDYEVSFNRSFGDVITACARRRVGQRSTWITDEMKDAYTRLHSDGWAHSVEVWKGSKLVGGLYGLAIGQAFFGESMFSGSTNASKAAMLVLCNKMLAHDFLLLDCQLESPHLMSLGAKLIARKKFAAELQRACEHESRFLDWPARRMQILEFLN